MAAENDIKKWTSRHLVIEYWISALYLITETYTAIYIGHRCLY